MRRKDEAEGTTGSLSRNPLLDAALWELAGVLNEIAKNDNSKEAPVSELAVIKSEDFSNPDECIT